MRRGDLVIYKVKLSNWGDTLEIGSTVEDINDIQIKVVTIVKIETDEGNILVHVLGVNIDDLY
jgi:hypothetical protein